MLKIGNKIVRNNPKEYYRIKIKNMHGDDDGTTYTEVDIPKANESAVEKIVGFLNWCVESWPGDKRIEDEWNRLEKEILTEYDELDEFIIDRDHTADNEFYCRPSLDRITYFDENGDEYQVITK